MCTLGWDRVPYLTDVGGREATLVPLYNEIHHNFLIANYESCAKDGNTQGGGGEGMP